MKLACSTVFVCFNGSTSTVPAFVTTIYKNSLAYVASLAVFKRRNRDNKFQSREEPRRETTEKPSVPRGFAALLALEK